MQRAYANLALSGPARYLVCSKVFSSVNICWPEKDGRVCFRFPSRSLEDWLPCRDEGRPRKWIKASNLLRSLHTKLKGTRRAEQ